MKNKSMKNKEMKGGIFGIPSFGILKSKDPTLNSVEPSKSPSSSSDIPAKSILNNSSPAGEVANDRSQEQIDNDRKNCIAEQDDIIKLANAKKEECKNKHPRKKIFGIFGGKKSSKKGLNKRKNKTKSRKNKKKLR